ncbi:hypothetical protein RHDE110596_04660 [Prescottella defluvii]|uniref:hypothetical protein n=1 Tax=Prescottella defluvii TaxID=1323361 RepID=UPI000A73C5A4|nr:hypothetical protein [Prescottella defluvii]
MTHRYLSRHSDHEILTAATASRRLETTTRARGRSEASVPRDWHHPEEVAG